MSRSEAAGVSSPRLVLVRHGQASLGAQDYDRLSELGQRQADQTGRRLASVLAAQPVFWTGTHRRHHQTATALAPDAVPKGVAALDEFSTFGLVRAAVVEADRLGLQRPDDAVLNDPRNHLQPLLDWFPEVLGAWQDGRLAAPDIDPWADFQQRVMSPVDGWRKSLCDGRSVVVVSSAGVISTLVAELAGRDLNYQRQLAVTMYNASVSELCLTVDGWRVNTVNCIEHLDAEGLVTLA